MFCCIFGHKIENDVCIKCGKTICEIKGHEWIYCEYKKFTNIGHTSTIRYCMKCKQAELAITINVWDENSTHINSKNWERIK